MAARLGAFFCSEKVGCLVFIRLGTQCASVGLSTTQRKTARVTVVTDVFRGIHLELSWSAAGGGGAAISGARFRDLGCDLAIGFVIAGHGCSNRGDGAR